MQERYFWESLDSEKWWKREYIDFILVLRNTDHFYVKLKREKRRFKIITPSF